MTLFVHRKSILFLDHELMIDDSLLRQRLITTHEGGIAERLLHEVRRARDDPGRYPLGYDRSLLEAALVTFQGALGYGAAFDLGAGIASAAEIPKRHGWRGRARIVQNEDVVHQ